MPRVIGDEAVALAKDALTLDPTRSTLVLIVGRKGSGKSAAARVLFDAWPADRVVIDPTGSARPDDPATIGLAAPFPSQLPEPDRDADPPQTRVTVWARISPASHTFTADQDAAMGMALHPRHRTKMIWRDEFGQGTSAHKILPNDNACLLSSRHFYCSALYVTQRPRNIPVPAMGQADKVLIFEVPNPDDREYVAKNCGIDVPLLERKYQEMRRLGKHSFLLFDRENDVLLRCPPLPNITARGPKA